MPQNLLSMDSSMVRRVLLQKQYFFRRICNIRFVIRSVNRGSSCRLPKDMGKSDCIRTSVFGDATMELNCV